MNVNVPVNRLLPRDADDQQRHPAGRREPAGLPDLFGAARSQPRVHREGAAGRNCEEGEVVGSGVCTANAGPLRRPPAGRTLRLASHGAAALRGVGRLCGLRRVPQLGHEQTLREDRAEPADPEEPAEEQVLLAAALERRRPAQQVNDSTFNS